MQRKNNSLEKRSQYIKIGFLFLIIALLIVNLDYFSTKKIHAWDTINNKIYFSSKEAKQYQPENIDEKKEETTETTETKEETKSETTSDYYVGYIEIPKIGLKRGFAPFGSPNNTISKNVTILPTSVYPDVDKGNFILAAHSGTGSIAYFKDLYRLGKGDTVTIYYRNTKYTYKIVDIYDVKKTGTVSVYRSYNETTLTLVTCTYNRNDKQTIYIANLINKSNY